MVWISKLLDTRQTNSLILCILLGITISGFSSYHTSRREIPLSWHMHRFFRSRLMMSSSFLTSLYQLVLWNRCWAPCTSNAIRHFWKKASSSNPFKKGGWYSIIGSSLRISLAIWIHLVWNLRFFLDSSSFSYNYYRTAIKLNVT